MPQFSGREFPSGTTAMTAPARGQKKRCGLSSGEWSDFPERPCRVSGPLPLLRQLRRLFADG